ncbi:outer membrane channel protein [compost metagenome]
MPCFPRMAAIGIATLSLAFPAAAAPVSLTLQEAMSLATQHNPRLAATRQAVQQAEAGLRQARSAYWPTLGLGGDLNRTSLTSVGAGLNLGLNLDTHGGFSASKQIADLQLSMARWTAASTAQQLRLDVTNAYYDLQDAEQQIRIAQISLSQAKSLLADAQAMQRGGEGTIFEVQRAEMRLLEAQQSEVEARGRQLISQRALVRQLGKPMLEGINRVDPVARGANWPLSLEASIARAQERRPEIHLTMAQLDLSEKKRQLALATYGIRTQLFANANTTSMMSVGNSALSLVSDGPGLGSTTTVGGRLSLSLFDGGSARAQADQAIHEAEAQRAELLSVQQAIRYEVEQAHVLLQVSESSMGFSDAALKKAQEALSAARQRLVAGVGTQTDLILAQNDLVQAEVRRNKAILDYNRALAALQKACFDLPLPESEPR